MNEVVSFLSQPFTALAIAQVAGLIVLLFGLDNDQEIAARSGTYWNYNSHMLEHLVRNNYDQKVGLFIVTLPTIFQAANNVPFWSSYLCLMVGLALRFCPIRKFLISKRIQKIEGMLKKNEEIA